MVKACIHYFLTNFYFSLNDSPSKTMKDVFISYKKLFSFSRYSNFCISIFPLFLTDSHCLRAWSKTNLKVYDVVNFLNINLIKQPFYARNFLKIRHFERRLSNTFEKVNFPFFRTQSLLMDKIITNKRGLELVPVALQVMKKVQKHFFCSYILSDQVWWCNIKRLYITKIYVIIINKRSCKLRSDLTTW